MLEDYCNKLQQLNKQKNDFMKLKYKTNNKTIIQKQQNKYHKYILSQIAYKNRLDSLFKFNIVISQIISQQKRCGFDLLLKKNTFKESKIQKSLSKSQNNDTTQTNSQGNSQKLISISNASLKQKMKKISINLLNKFVHNWKKKIMNSGFKVLQRNLKIIKHSEFLFNLIDRKILFQKNVFFEQLKLQKCKQARQIQSENRDNKSFIFSLNEFSQIIPYTIEQESEELSTSRIKNIEEIDSKFKPLSQSKIQGLDRIQQEQNQYRLMLQSFDKLKEQILIMKNLLSQKNKQLKLKDEQIYKIKKDYEKKIQTLHDDISDKIQKQYELKDSVLSTRHQMIGSKIEKNNDSYLKQLQTHIIGDRSPRGNQPEEDPVSYQLLQKYMKESFQMRQKMDMAREMCEQFEFDSRTDEGQIMLEIIKLLTPQERLNAFVD